MTFPQAPRVIYDPNPLIEVISQVRFPPILRISTEAPDEFQDLIRSVYPMYSEAGGGPPLTEGLPTQVQQLVEGMMSGHGGDGQNAHDFASEDGDWTVGLRRDFVSLTTSDYRRWEDFRERMSDVLDALAIYEPHHATRIGLRYRDVITRSKLGIEDVQWSELLTPAIAGELADPAVGGAVDEVRKVIHLTVEDIEIRVRHGLATGDDTSELSYLIDADIFTQEGTDAGEVLNTLDRCNRLGGLLFRWCISDRLHIALNPTPVKESLNPTPVKE